jgi:putative transposase
MPLPGTTSSNVTARGDYPSEQSAILTLREFERIFALEILGPYHNEMHSVLGTTPAAAWADGVAASAALGYRRTSPRSCSISCPSSIVSFDVKVCAFSTSPTSTACWRSCRVKYDHRDMSAGFVELTGGGHLRIPCADLGRPPVTLWEQRAAIRTLRKAGLRSIDETAIFTAIAEQRRVLAEVQASSKLARRAFARLAERRSTTVSARRSPSTQTESDVNEVDKEAWVPAVAEDDVWGTEFHT